MIEVQDVTKHYNGFTALDGVSLHVAAGSLTALLGPSGSGKSTLLRVIAGLESPDGGSVLIDDDDATTVPPRRRGVGFVFQHYAAFKHMTVRSNIAFGLKVRKRPKAEIRERVDELLALVHLEGWANRYPAQLSGGQRQRMALARALAVQPRVLLLDEPFGALDAQVREELRIWLRRLHDEVHVTTVFVTHDQEEAMDVAEQVAVINEGRIEQIGSPRELYEAPAGHPPGRRRGRPPPRRLDRDRAGIRRPRGAGQAGGAPVLRSPGRARARRRARDLGPAHARRGRGARARARSHRVGAPDGRPPRGRRLSLSRRPARPRPPGRRRAR